MTPIKKGFISALVVIILFSGLLSGCTAPGEQGFTGSVKTLEPDLGDDWRQWNYTYEENYDEKVEFNPTYGIVIPEYLFIRYNGTSEKKSMNIIICKMDANQDSPDVYERYKENLLEHGEVIENETIGDESIVARTTIALPGGGVVFRKWNCVVVVGGFIEDLTELIDVAKQIEEKISSALPISQYIIQSDFESFG